MIEQGSSKTQKAIRIKNVRAKGFRARLREFLRVPMLYREWQHEKRQLANPSSPDPLKACNSILIAPCDPVTLAGSKGDEAMITAFVERIREFNPDCRFGLLTYHDRVPETLAGLGARPEPVWANPKWSLRQLVRTVSRYEGLAIVGGDVMDGYYTPLTALRLWVVGDMAARLGKRSAILGFSFNDKPSPRLRRCLDSLDRRFVVSVRDEVSLERFRRFSATEARLVADAAFLLRPSFSERIEAVCFWADSQRAAGRTVVGFNLHPMLIKEGDQTRRSAMIDASITALRNVAVRDDVSYLLISHDFRGGPMGDEAVLGPIFEGLQGELGERIRYWKDRFSAKELKAIAGVTDAVLTGRMHLAVAALGQGVPIVAVTYQGKFEGLLRHFDLPERLAVSPETILVSSRLASLIDELIASREVLAASIAEFWPRVERRALLNIEPFLAQGADAAF
ncbi:polysaccharide pyruvyl transferase family protein [Methylocaldum sp.]|uniref:polysaccharide pyruvyl transferase family protein n=1 Tax=Methylocaldum sp. TaxID=1969727 RepID=UPI002D2E34BB|nr:polysaccharide pyruvyl transferase family protein [Methylocaldum sp.]HYE35026.1 polysaccharide pyruvyl transferase family protein [Methylocaldum sp.]